MEYLQQISVFVENRAGRLAEVTASLADAGVDIRALTLADAQDFGILRLITECPAKAEQAIRAAGFTVKTTPVLCVAMRDSAGSLDEMLRVLNAAGLDIRYCYAFVSRRVNGAFVVIRVADNEAASLALEAANYTLYGQDALSGL